MKKCERKLTPMMLINEANKLFHDRMKAEETHLHLHGSYAAFLFHLSFRDGRSQLELAKLCNLRASTTSITLRKMETDDLIRRKTDQNDQRQTLIYLTEKGREAARRMHSQVMGLDNAALSGLNTEEIEFLKPVLQKIIQNLKKYQEDYNGR